ncbi:MAG: cbb3-type cytochrome oxidase assembly protein CcoS [Burkholderiaceae bacterium]|nr:cbb3-type cytochrome oxidase assembly protein CcoS [Burkholderiaceae bacterium]
MSVLLMLIPVSLLFVAVGAVAFFWAVNHDQFDDMDTPGLLPLADSDLVADAWTAADQPARPADEAADSTLAGEAPTDADDPPGETAATSEPIRSPA